MPNSRRRKFSVRNGIAGREPTKVQNDLQSSGPSPDPDIKTTVNNLVAMKCSLSKNKMQPQSSRNTDTIDITTECESSSSLVALKKPSNTLVDKDVTASPSNIDLCNILYASKDSVEPWNDYKETMNTIGKNEMLPKMVTRQTRERTSVKREKYPREHRVKVRSPKRRMAVGILDTLNNSNDVRKPTFSVATDAIDWEHEAEISEDNVVNVAETNEEDERQSDHSSDDMCRICHGDDSLSQELGQLISACMCRGTVGRVHVKCLERWLTESGKSRCELCGTRYMTRRVHRYGVPRALLMWILSQNAKQLMVDSLGIMLMSPLAVLAAWLSGRTLAGLMTQDGHATPWPLASTFVLACMTLVCYYCWIVSAATRHALGWWIWYRSQYEVRLELLDTEE